MAKQQDPLRSIYNDLGLEQAGITYDKFSTKFMSDSNARRSVYNDLGLEQAGVNYDLFEERLGVKKKELSQSASQSGVETFGQPSVPSPEFEASNARYANEADRRLAELSQPSENLAQVDTSQFVDLTPEEMEFYGYNQPERKSFFGDIYNSVAAGSAGLGEMIAGIPDLVYNIFAIPQNLLADAIDNNAGPGTADWLRANYQQVENIGPLRTISRVRDYYAGLSEEYQNEVTQFDQGIFDSITSGDLSGAGRQVANSIAQSVPSIVAMVGTGGGATALGAGRTGAMIASSIPFASGEYQQIVDSPDIPELAKPVVALAKGLSEVIYEQSFGTGKLVDDIIKGSIKQDGVKRFITGYMDRVLASNSIPASIVKGSISEAATTLSQNLITKYSGENPDLDVWDGVADAAIVGGVMDSAISTPGSLSRSITNSSERKEAVKLSTENDAILADLHNTEVELSNEDRNALMEVYDSNTSKIEQYLTKSQQERGKLTEAQQQVQQGLLDRAASYQSILDNETVSDETKSQVEERLKETEQALERQVEVDNAIVAFQEANPGIEVDYLDDLPESVVTTFDRVDAGLPTDPVAIEEASKWMYDKYKELTDLKSNPDRRLTISQIEGMQEQLGADITLLENYKLEQYGETTESTQLQPETTVDPIADEAVQKASEERGAEAVVTEESSSQPGEYFTRDIGGEQTVYRRNEDGTASIVPDAEAQRVLAQQAETVPVSDEVSSTETTPQQEAEVTSEAPISSETTQPIAQSAQQTSPTSDPAAAPTETVIERPVSKRVVDTPVSEIQTDETSFQNRESLDESRVQDIVDNFNEAALDPIVLYNDNGKTVVLSGHHRLAAAQKMGMETIPSRFFEGTKQQAIDFARDSNTLSRAETSTERASRYRDMRSRGETEASIREKARVAHGSDATKIINLSHLSESGKALEAINSFSESTDVNTKNKVEAIGDWIGNVKSRHPDLSTRQENEMFDYLMDKYGTKKKSGSVTSRAQFFDVANALINRLKDKGSFNEDSVLNLNNAAGKTGIELEYDQALSDAKDAVDAARKALDDARKRAVAEGIGPDRMSDLLSPLENNLRNALADEQAVRAQKGRLQEAVKAQTSIFDVINENEQTIKNDATVEREVQSAFNGKPTKNTEASRSGQEVRQESRRDRAGRSETGQTEKLEGSPTVKGATGPDPILNEVARKYAESIGIDFNRQTEYVEVDVDRAERIAKAYDEMEHDPSDPAVKEAYENLIRQTKAQYDALSEAGYVFYFYDDTNDPYNGSPWEAMRDLRRNKKMAVFATEAGYGSSATDIDVSDNPLLQDTGLEWGYGSPNGPKKRVTANDLFRAVHDAFGHGLEGAGFRARGEENAWQAHARLFTGSAIGALTTETRGQNSWLNYGPYGDKNRNAKVEDTIFADQKTGLMPEWTWKEGFDGVQYDTPSVSNSEKKDPSSSKTKKPRTPKTLLKGVLDKLAGTGLATSVKTATSAEITKNLGVNGENVNGYIDGDGAIVINSEKATLDTPIHEFAHAWEEKVAQDNPTLHARGMELIKTEEGKPYVDHVKKTQPGLKGDALYREALAQSIGDRGARLIDSKRGNRIKEWLNDVWDYISGLVGISGMTADQISNLTLNEFADAVAVDLLSGKPVSVAPNGDIVVDIQAEKKSDMNESEKRIADFMERMRNKNNIRFQGEIDPSTNRLSQEDLIEFIIVAGDLVRLGKVKDFAELKSFANSIGITNNGDITAAWASAKNFVDNKNSTSGFKKAKIQTDLIGKSTNQKMSDAEYVETGKRIVDEGLVNPNDLVAELLENGRVLQDFEQAALTYAKTQLDNRINENRAKLRKDPTNVDLRIEADSLFSLLNDYDIAIAVSGEHWSRSGRLRQVEMDKDYNAVYTLQEMDKIGEVPADVRARIEELGRELQEAKADLALRMSEIDALKEAQRQAGINSASSVNQRKGRMNTAARKAAVEVLDSLDLSSFGVSAMRFQTNGGLRFSISPDSALQASLQGAVAKMKADIASGKVRLEDALESAINTVNSEVGEGNWNSIAFRSSVVNSFADKGNTVKPRKPYVGRDGKPVVPSAYLNDIVSAHRSANGRDMTIDEMVQSAKSELGQSFSDRDIRDSISGYGNATTNRMSDDRKNISTAKTIGRLQSRLEELENLGYSTISRQPRARQVNQEIEDLKKTINDMIDSLHDSDDYKSQMRSARENKKKYIQEYIKDVEERITAYREANRKGEKIPDGYFSKKPKYDFTSDPEIIELERKREDMRNKLKEEVYRHRIRNRSVTDIMLDTTEQVLFNTTRMLTAGADLSAVLVQGGFITLSDPVSSVKALKLSVEKAGNKDLYDQYFHDLQRKPLFELARASKLNMQLPEFYQSIQEEQFGSQNIITKAYEYIIDKAFGENKKGAKKWKDGFPYSAAERQYGMFLTEIRFNLFEKSVNDAINYFGIDINSDAGKDAMGRIAESINDMTMASNIKLIEGSSRTKKLVSMVMFSARKFAASWKLMYKVPYYGINFAINKGTSLVGGKTAASIKTQTDFNAFLFQNLYGRYAGTAMGMVAATTIIPTLIANGLYNPDEDEEPPMMYNPNVLNPSHSDFMKLRWGNTRIDMSIGLGGNIVFLTRLFGSGYMTSSDPIFKRYDENVAGFRNKSRGEVAMQYFVNKLAPTPSIAYNHWFGNEYQRAETGDRIAESLYPMWLGGAIDQYNDTNNIGSTMAFFGMGMLGLANNTYGGVEFSDHRGTNNAEARRIFERLLISDSTPERRTKVMYSPSSGVTKLQNSDFKQEYRDSYNEYMTSLTLAMKPLLLEKGLRPETVESMVNNMKSKAYKYAEVKATGVFVDEKFREVSNKKGDKFKLSNPQIKEKAAIIAQIMSSEKVQGMKPQLTKGYGKIYKSKGYLENKQLLDMDVYLELYDVAESMADIKMMDMIEKGKISPIPIKDYDKRTDNDGGYE